MPKPKIQTVKLEDGTSFKVATSVIKDKPGAFLWEPKPPTGPDPIKVKQYFGGGTRWNNEGAQCRGNLPIPVLEFLWGRKLDEVVTSYLHALRPSMVRITESCINLDCCRWRVTVLVKKIKRTFFVNRIEQEVPVLLPDGVAHGDALRLALRYGISSPQVKWHRDATGYMSGPGDYHYKSTAQGTVKWTFKPGKPSRKLWRNFHNFYGRTTKHRRA